MSSQNDLVKALEAGSYNAAPGSLVQGSALQVEDLSPVMENVCFTDKTIKLSKSLKSVPCKSLLWQFDRQLSYGQLGQSAVYEGNIGGQQNSEYIRAVVPMCFYSTTRVHTLQAELVQTVDGKNAKERQASDAAVSLAMDIEFDLYRGQSNFSNAGEFDGNPGVIPNLPNVMGIDQQVRYSDIDKKAQDQMFAAYGSGQSIIIKASADLDQTIIEEASLRSVLNAGNANSLHCDPVVVKNYNLISYNATRSRILIGQGNVNNIGSNLSEQWTSTGLIKFEPSMYLRAKMQPQVNSDAPSAPATLISVATGADGDITAGSYYYYVTAVNDKGESVAKLDDGGAQVVALHEHVTLTIAAVTGAKYYNIYRSAEGGTNASAKFIGSSRSTTFVDLGNRLPGFSNAYLLQDDTMEIRELASFSKVDMPQAQLTIPTAFYRFLTLAITQPRKNVIIDNLDSNF